LHHLFGCHIEAHDLHRIGLHQQLAQRLIKDIEPHIVRDSQIQRAFGFPFAHHSAIDQILPECLFQIRHFEVMLAHDRPLALRLIVWQLPDLIILEARLAGDDGIALCASLKRDRRTRGIPIVIVTGADDHDEHLRCVDAGADDYVISADCRRLAARAGALLRGRHNAEQEKIESVVESLGRAVEAKDGVTGGHLQRVAGYAMQIGDRLGLRGAALNALRYGALLHDIGKIGVDEAALRKPGPLTADEYRQVQQHPLIGEQIVQPLSLAALIGPIVRGHHERWDGRGYPG